MPYFGIYRYKQSFQRPRICRYQYRYRYRQSVQRPLSCRSFGLFPTSIIIRDGFQACSSIPLQPLLVPFLVLGRNKATSGATFTTYNGLLQVHDAKKEGVDYEYRYELSCRCKNAFQTKATKLHYSNTPSTQKTPRLNRNTDMTKQNRNHTRPPPKICHHFCMVCSPQRKKKGTKKSTKIRLFPGKTTWMLP